MCTCRLVVVICSGVSRCPSGATSRSSIELLQHSKALKSSLHIHVAHTHYGSHYSFRYFISTHGSSSSNTWLCPMLSSYVLFPVLQLKQRCEGLPVLQLKQRCEGLSHKARHLRVTVSQGFGARALLHTCFCTLCHSSSIVACSLHSSLGSSQLVIST
jgi:hypothetical protein